MRHGLLADIATMTLAAFAFVRNVDPSSIVLGWDIDGSFLDAPLALHRALSSWTDHPGLGSDATPSHAAIPILGFESLLHYLHFAPAGIEWTTFACLYLLVPLAMLVYCRSVFPGELRLRVIATLCATFNFYHAITWYTPLPVYEAGLAAGVATAAAIVAFALRRTYLTAVGLIAVTALTATSGGNFAVGIVVIALVACLVGIALMKRPELRAQIVMPLVICAALNLFWLAPTIYFYSSQQGRIRNSDYVTQWSDYALAATSEAATIPNVVRLIGTWDWTHADSHGHKYVRFADAYDHNLLLTALSFVVPLLAALAFLRVRMAPVRFALIVSGVALFLMKGTAPPLGDLYKYAYQHLPGFLMFRDPYSKFGAAAAPLMALLAGIGLSAATERLSTARKIVSTAVVALLIAVSISAYWSGLMFRHNKYMPTYYVKLPNSYFEVADLLNRKPNQQTRAIVLPFSPQLSFTALDWNFNGPDSLPYLVNRPLIVEPASWADPYTHLALTGIDQSPEALSTAASENAIEYAIVHRDIVTSFYSARSAPETETLVAAAGFKRTWVSQDGKLALYQRPLRPYTGIDFSSQGYLLAHGTRNAARSFFGGDIFGPAKLRAVPKPELVPVVAAPFSYMAALRPSHTFVFRCVDDRLARNTALPTFTGAEVFYDRRSLQPNEAVSVKEGWHEVQVASSASPISSMRIVAQSPTSVRFALWPHARGDQLIVTYHGNNRIGATVRVAANGIESIPNPISIDGPVHRVLLVSAKTPLREVFVDLVGPDIARLARSGVFHFQTATLTTDAVIRLPPILRMTARLSLAPMHNATTLTFATGGAAQEDVTHLRSQVTVIDRRHAPSAASSGDRVALTNLESAFSDAKRAAWMPAAGFLSLGSITNDHWAGYLNGMRLTKADRLGLYNAWYVPHAGLVTLRYEPQGIFELSSRISLIALLFLFALVFSTKRVSTRMRALLPDLIRRACLSVRVWISKQHALVGLSCIVKKPVVRERLLTISIVTACAIFLPLWSTPSHRLIAGGDGILPELSPHIWLNRLATLWGYYAGTGKDIAFADGWLPIVLIDALLSKLGASTLVLNHFWLVAFFVMQALGVCFLYRTIFPERGPVVSSVFAGLASILNPFVLITFHSPYLPSALCIALFPWLLGLFRRYARSGSPMLLAWFTFGCLFDVVADVNIAYIMLQFAIMVAVLVFSLAEKGEPGMRWRAIAMIGVFVCAHAPVLWGISENLHMQMAEIGRSMHEYSVGVSSEVADTSRLSNVCRLIGTVLFFRNVGGKPFLIGNGAYNEDLRVIAASYVLPLLAVTALFLRAGKRRVVAAIVGIAALAVIASNGGAKPFGAIFSWALVHVPGFVSFRDPFSKFGWIIVVTYALAAAWVIDRAARGPRFIRISVITVALAGLVGSAFPMFTKHLFWEQMKVDIPPAYQTMATTFNTAGGDGRILQSPVSPTLFETYTWGYVGSGVSMNLISRPIANRAGAFESAATEKLLALLENDGRDIGTVEAQRVLAFLNFTQVIDDASFFGNFFQPMKVAHIGPGDAKLFAPRETIGQLTSYDVRVEAAKVVYSPTYAVTGVASYDDLGLACRLIECARTVFLQKSVDGLTATSFETVGTRLATAAWFKKHAGQMIVFRGGWSNHGGVDSLTRGLPAVKRAVAIGLKQVSTPAVAGQWSAPIDNPRVGGRPTIIADRMSPSVHIVRLGERADIHSRIENVQSGTHYQVSFDISNGVDRSALLLVTDERLGAIANAVVADRVQGSVVRFPFKNPIGNHACYLYLYLPKAGPVPVDVTVSRARIDRDDLAEEVAAMHKTVALATPRTLTYARRPEGYDVEVKSAPPMYLIAFNVTENPNWHLIPPPGVTARRLRANLYEQAWLVRGAGTYSLRLAYRPDVQRPAITIASFVGLLFALAMANLDRLFGKKAHVRASRSAR